MIHVTCESCGSKLNAKDELAGQTRKCPKCGTPILISPPDAEPLENTGPPVDTEPLATVAEATVVKATDDLEGDPHVQISDGKSFASEHELPERLDRLNRYMICDKSRLVAAWENNGNGWMLKTNFGFISAIRNHEQLPSQGDFKLVELRMKMTDGGLRLIGLRVYQLAKRWALTKLERGDDEIVAAVSKLGFLNRDQKSIIRKAIRDLFMRHVWEHSDNVLDYLGSSDYHSAGVG